jgi:hypothetical protein
VALLEKRRFLNNRSGDSPQVILILSQSRAEQLKWSSYFLLANRANSCTLTFTSR